jgi:hypothetical protein
MPHFGIETDDVSELANEKAWIALGEHLKKYGEPVPLKTSYAYGMALIDEQLKETDDTGLLDCYQIDEKRTVL